MYSAVIQIGRRLCRILNNARRGVSSSSRRVHGGRGFITRGYVGALQSRARVAVSNQLMDRTWKQAVLFLSLSLGVP